jgi:hypothetical protein
MRAQLLVVIALALAGVRVAHAYPQFQLSRDATCTGCHLAPDGGGALNENGIAAAEAIAWKGGDGNFLHGMGTPSWLELSGDIRVAAGYVHPGTPSAAAYPMQAEVGADVHASQFSLHVVGGLRRPQEGGSLLHVLWSREHYAMWQPTDGVSLRVGRLSPTFGLRLAEHVVYTQRFGGAPLFDEAYAVAAAIVRPRWEVHATGFVHDPYTSTVEKGDGGALYMEVRLGEHAALGVEGKYSKADEVTRSFGGATAKLYLPSADLLLLAEGQVIRADFVGGSRVHQIAGYLMGSRPLGGGFLFDLGLGHFTQDTRVKDLYRDCVDANLHWFWTSHTELLLTARAERLGDGPFGGYALAQLHYRL